MSKQRIQEDWPDDVKDYFARYPGSTMLVKTSQFGDTTVFKTRDYKPPADGVDHLHPVPISGVDA